MKNHHAPFAKRTEGQIRRTTRRNAIARKAMFLNATRELN